MGAPGASRAAEVGRVVAEHLPGYRIDAVAQLGEGQDNTAYEVDGELIVRFRKDADPARRAELVSREARLLDAVASISPVPVPKPVFTAPREGCLAYPRLPGVSLLDVPDGRRRPHAIDVAATLGDLLAALHATPFSRAAELVGTDDPPLDEWRREAAGLYAGLGGHVPAAHRARIEAFFRSSPPASGYTPVFSHNDLGIEHVLVDPRTCAVTGVIDWSDAAIVDPASDFGLLYLDLGTAALDAALRLYRARTAATEDVERLRERALFYARCDVFEELQYGIETAQPRYVEKSLAALDRLFAD